MMGCQRFAVHRPHQHHLRAECVLDRQAAGEILAEVLLADFLHLFIGTVKDHLLGPLDQTEFLEDWSQRSAGPPHVADGSHKPWPEAVAPTLQGGGDGFVRPGLKVGEREDPWVLEIAGELDLPAPGVDRARLDLRLWIMADFIQVLRSGDPFRQVLPLQHFAGGLDVEEGDEGLPRFRLQTPGREGSGSQGAGGKGSGAPHKIAAADGGFGHGRS